MRGGNWYNGENGHSRVSNRNPSYYRGPQDPDHPYYHLGFRVVLPINAESRPVIKPTPVQNIRGQGNPPGGGGKRPRPGGRQEGKQRPGGGGDGDRPPRPEQQQEQPRNVSSAAPRHQGGSFVLSSPAVQADGVLPKEFTGDGESISPPLEWTGAPAGTKSFALIMHHIDPKGMTKWYWPLYNIPADVKSLPKNVKNIGTAGNNSVNRDLGYAPPHSKGPGAKTYILTLYALSAPPQFTVAPEDVSREVLLAAIKDKTLANAELSVNYTRSGNANDAAGERRPGPDRPPRDGNRQGNNRPPPPQNQ
jgi:Raf kinase inhibitor-like YbhB/YbcL family protein